MIMEQYRVKGRKYNFVGTVTRLPLKEHRGYPYYWEITTPNVNEPIASGRCCTIDNARNRMEMILEALESEGDFGANNTEQYLCNRESYIEAYRNREQSCIITVHETHTGPCTLRGYDHGSFR